MISDMNLMSAQIKRFSLSSGANAGEPPLIKHWLMRVTEDWIDIPRVDPTLLTSVLQSFH